MVSLQYVKLEDRVDLPPVDVNTEALRPDRLSGDWRNTDSASLGIGRIIIEARGPALFVRAFGAGDPEPFDWGEAPAGHLYANSISSNLAAGFTARYRRDSSETHLQANWNQGLLVLASFTTFTDGSLRSNTFSREFFHRSGT